MVIMKRCAPQYIGVLLISILTVVLFLRNFSFIGHHKVFPSPSIRSTIISYIIRNVNENNEKCLQNLELFLENGIVHANKVTYLFKLIDVPSTPTRLSQAASDYKNIIIEKSNEISNDFAHRDVIGRYLRRKDAFVLLDCSSRGPYFARTPINTLVSNLSYPFWLTPFLNKLRDDIHAVGTSSLCPVSAGVKTFALAMDRKAAAAYLADSHRSCSDECLTKQLLNHNVKVDAIDRRLNRHECQPSVCTPFADRDCVDPCEFIFADPAHNSSLDERCFGVTSHSWNISSLFLRVREYSSNAVELVEDETSRSLVLVRAHDGYAHQLLAFLETLRSLNNSSPIRVIVIPTEQGSARLARSLDHFRSFERQSRSLVRVSLLQIPDWIFNTYGSYINNLCTDAWKHEMVSSGRHSARDVSRHCLVNSPLHYLLVDIVLHYGLQHCLLCNRLLVTNADNNYSPKFFQDIMMNVNLKEFDVVMTNMVTRGHLLPVQARKGRVDLGAYVVSMPFLRKSGIRFLNSLPRRPQANDFHDADGHLIEQVQARGAKIKIIQEYLFYHH